MPIISTIAAATARAFGAFKSAVAGAGDEFFNYVTLLLNGDGTNGAQNNTFQDSSVNNFTITRNGNTTQGTFSPFSQTGWSNYFDGSGDYLSASSNAAFAASGVFTWECWFYPNTFDQAASNGDGLFITNATGGFQIGRTSTSQGNAWGIAAKGVAWVLFTTSLPTNNTWNHLVICRNSSNTLSIFLNGTRVATTTSSQSFAAGDVGVGGGYGIDNADGYLSNMRLVVGTDVYGAGNSSLTVPTTPLTAISGTSLLTCQSNRFRDASTNNFAITVNGNTSVQAFSPFAPTAAYSAATVGGSGYFDGSGDYLSAPSGACVSGTGDFTIECWAYIASIPSSYRIIGANGTSNGISGPIVNANGTVFYGRSLVAISGTTTNTVQFNAWNHLAVCRSSGTTRIFINGVQGYSGADTFSYASGSPYIGVDGDGSSYPFLGNIANFRISPTARYTSGFTPPASPLTDDANTRLLLNFTNAGIIDNTAKNVLETVGNAQISTSVKKFGTGSLAFDGTGDWLLVPDTPALRMESGDFTIEFWINWTSISGYQTPLDKGYTTAGGLLFQTGNGNGRFVIYASGSAVITESGTASTGTWIHYALVRNGTTLTLYRDGTSVGSATNSTNFNITTQLLVGANNAGSGTSIGQYPFNGYIDDLRITKGIARYASNFTPPTAAYKDL
jgi:hypothetical protein